MKRIYQTTVVATFLVLLLPISIFFVWQWGISNFTSTGMLAMIYYLPITIFIATTVSTFYILYQVKQGNREEIKFPIILAALFHVLLNIFGFSITIHQLQEGAWMYVMFTILVFHLPSIILGICPVLYLRKKK